MEEGVTEASCPWGPRVLHPHCLTSHTPVSSPPIGGFLDGALALTLIWVPGSVGTSREEPARGKDAGDTAATC